MGEIGSRSKSHTLCQDKFRMVNELNIKKETINKLGEHRIVYLSDLWDGEDFITKQELEKKLQKVKLH